MQSGGILKVLKRLTLHTNARPHLNAAPRASRGGRSLSAMGRVGRCGTVKGGL